MSERESTRERERERERDRERERECVRDSHTPILAVLQHVRSRLSATVKRAKALSQVRVRVCVCVRN